MMSSSPPASRVIVVGSGLAGLSAAHAALERGAPVHLLDRAPKPGGNSIKASSGINGAGTAAQAAAGIDDSPDAFAADTTKSAGERYRAPAQIVDRTALISKLTAESASAVSWLVDDIGVDLSVVAVLGGHSVPRTHRGGGKLPPGAAIVMGLLNKLKENPNFTLSSGAEVTDLVVEAGAVKGVKYTQAGEAAELDGAVVFAAGGFAGDRALLARHRPDLAGMPSTNDERPGAHALLANLGVPLLDMDSVQVHPTGFVDPANVTAPIKFLAGEMLRGEGGILLGPDGKRFVNELGTRAKVSGAIMARDPDAADDGTKQWATTIVLDPGASEAAKSHIGFYAFKGLLRKVRTAELDPGVRASVDEYAGVVQSGAADPFGRKNHGRWSLAPGEDAEVYIGQVTPVTHFTMGGAAIDTSAHVLREEGGSMAPVPGIWAAGEITGGVHGDNRLGGSSLLECVVFGRTAGKAAAAGVNA
jgi:flavocytochrome c